MQWPFSLILFVTINFPILYFFKLLLSICAKKCAFQVALNIKARISSGSIFVRKNRVGGEF